MAEQVETHNCIGNILRQESYRLLKTQYTMQNKQVEAEDYKDPMLATKKDVYCLLEHLLASAVSISQKH